MSQSAVRITTGMMDFSGGVNSAVVPLIASQRNPNGLKPNQCAWANNGNFDNGTIQPRPGLEYLTTLPIVAQFNDAFLYEPSGEFPYLMSYIGGRVFKTLLDVLPAVTVEIPSPADPAAADLGFTVQGEEFLVHQCGDGTTLPLFWDGETMVRSAGPAVILGIVSVLSAVPAVGSSFLVTLTAPFQGTLGETVFINGKAFQATSPNDFITVETSVTSFPGSVIPAGAVFNTRPGGVFIATTTADFIVPNATVPVSIPITPPYVGVTPAAVSLVDTHGGYTNLNTWAITAVGVAPPGPNQVYLTNLTGIPGDPIPVGDTLETAPQLPAGLAMDYYMGRIWICNGREYLAGDIVGGPSGSAIYGYRNSILYMTENAFTVSGGAFIVPSQAGNIRALKHPANLDTALGEGQLLPMTRRNIYSTNVSPTRAEWAELKEPIQRVAQINYGTVSDRSVVTVNADLYYQAVDGVRSFKQGIRYVNEGPGNVPLSQEEQRIFDLNDRSLLRWATGVDFNTRLLQSVSPYATPVGVAHRGAMPLNFVPLNTMANKLPPIWEGVWEGVSVLKWLKGDFGGRQRCFGVVWSELNQAIEVWEQTQDAPEDQIAPQQVIPGTSDGQHSRITWSFETPAFDWGDAFAMKQLDSLELWVDRLTGTVDFSLEWRPDQFPCWVPWNRWQECSAKNECELINALLPCDHPTQVYPPSYRASMAMPQPPIECNQIMGRPMHRGYTFQFRLTIKGQCRVRGLLVHALPLEKQPYTGLVCPA